MGPLTIIVLVAQFNVLVAFNFVTNEYVFYVRNTFFAVNFVAIKWLIK